jgi:drug/metabolite transporter (DMT)-like permease
MSEGLISLEGTEQGHTLALFLALFAAFLHAFFGALQKGRHDPWLSRGAIDLSYGLMAAPFALFVVPWPEPHMWVLFAGALVIHTFYKVSQGFTYSMGAYTVVYPVVRGIFGLAFYNLRTITVGRETMVSALMLAVLTGCFVAVYTTYDAYGIRATANPFTFLAWFFMLDGIAMPIVAGLRYRQMVPEARPALGPLGLRGIIGGLVAFFSFGGVMLATRLDNVGQAAVLRETSTVFAALIGWLVLKEQVGPRRLALMALIALGAVIVEMGG